MRSAERSCIADRWDKNLTGFRGERASSCRRAPDAVDRTRYRSLGPGAYTRDKRRRTLPDMRSAVRAAAWDAVHEALPARWAVGPISYDPWPRDASPG